MEQIYLIFRELSLPDDLTDIIIFKYNAIKHPCSTLIENKLQGVIKPNYSLDSIRSYMWGLDRSLNKIISLFCYDCNTFLIDIGRVDSIKQHRRTFNNTIYKDNRFEFSYVYYLNRLIRENNYSHKSVCVSRK